MADSASELESDTSSIDGGPTMKAPSPGQLEQLQKRLESLMQENRVLRMEVDAFKLKCRTLQEENRDLRRASVTIQARAEQEEEYISNTLLKKIQALKKEKETLAMNYEQEEEYLTNDLSRKLMQLRQEKVELEETLEKEQEYQVNKLMRKIEKLEADTLSKQATLEQLRREKVELENALEQEQEALVNKLWKRMDKLEAEKRMLQEKLDQPVSAPPSPRDMNNGDTAANLSEHIQGLRSEVNRLRNNLSASQAEHNQKMAEFVHEERLTREENLRLQRKLQMEVERREALCRHLSESESSLEMDDERHFNEMTKQHENVNPSPSSSSSQGAIVRPRTVSSPIPYQSPSSSRPLSPGPGTGQQQQQQQQQQQHLHQQHTATCPSFGQTHPYSPPSPMRCATCGQVVYHSTPTFLPGTSPPVFSHHPVGGSTRPRPSPDKFVKPAAPVGMDTTMKPKT